MDLSISKTGKKIGRPPTDATPVMVRVAPDLLAPLDAFIASQLPEASRPEAIRYLLRDHLIGLGFLKPPPDDPEMAN